MKAPVFSRGGLVPGSAWVGRVVRGLCVALLWWAAAAPGLRAEEELRSWTRAADGRTIEAKLVDYDPDRQRVKLKLKSGKDAEVGAELLSEGDQEFLADYLARQKEQAAELEAAREAAKVARSESFTPEDAGGHKVHVYKPAGYVDGDPANAVRPVAFLYSPGGKSKSIVQRLQPASDELGWLLVGIDAYRNTSSLEDRYEERMKDTRAAFEAVSENLVFDSKKIVFGGMSGGGWWSFQSASELTMDAAGILSFGGWMGKMHDKKYSKKMAVAMINGDGDKAALSNEEPDGEFLKRKCSADIKTFHFPGGHVLAPEEVALEAARWIHETKGFAAD